MVDSTDMTTPVTRGELREELAQLEQRLEQKLDQKLEQKLDQKLAHFATKAELEIWGGALAARFTELSAELARHAQAIHEAATRQIAALDDKYSDLPKRMTRLEGRVFGRRR